ncbi:MAG: CCA tRNA nucleotidyltransferase [Pelagibacterium sp.]|uniref:CCA tRNA nucleotidyltransferase n=1 Tax=Pelagibacterium sp. TaxID=1967288 RepID=UPI0032ED8E59
MRRDAALERLRRAPWLDTARPFFACLDGADGKTRAVGGIVRDTLLGLDDGKADIDLASELLPDEVAERGTAAGMNVHPTGADHGTMTLVHNGRTAEVTTLRRDVETFGRKAKVAFGTDWTEDAKRRDFTMNALYCGPDGELFDPLGGLDDCLSGRVQFIGDPDARIAEDRLRVYRYFRFVVSHGNQQFDEIAIAACQRAAGDLGALSAERVGHEMTRLMSQRQCAKALTEMTAIGVLSTTLFSPRALSCLTQLETFQTPVDAEMRIAVMAISGAAVASLRDKWRLSNATMARINRLMGAADLARKGKLEELAYRYGGEGEAALALAAAIEGRAESWLAERLNTITAIEPGAFPLSGSDLVSAGYVPGPAVGAELQRLENLWIESGFSLDRTALLALARPV